MPAFTNFKPTKPFANAIHRPPCILSRLAFVCLLTIYMIAPDARAESTGPLRVDGTLEFVSPDGRTNKTITVEIAESRTEKEKGLMWQTEMSDDAGMLFVYDRPAPRVFWMRNTPLSLDIVFVSEKGIILNIASHTQPMSDTHYASAFPARYIVEVVAGFCDRYGIRPGTRIRWRRCP